MSCARPSPAFTIAIGVSAMLLPLVAGCSGNGDPFAYVKASGKVTYDDGSLIPARFMMLNFIPETGPVGKLYPRTGTTTVDVSTGEFHSVTSHTGEDGVVRGKLKVTITGTDALHPLPAELVPPEYADPKKTPLEVDSDNVPFHIKIAKPAAR